MTVEVPDSWTTVYVYTWDDTDYSIEPFGEYPGSVMTNRTDNTYELELDVSIHNLVFSNQERQKTDDLHLDTNRDVKLKIASDGSVTFVRNAIVEPPLMSLSEYRVVGNADWLGN